MRDDEGGAALHECADGLLACGGGGGGGAWWEVCFGGNFFWGGWVCVWGGGSNVPSSSRTGGRTYTHPGVDEDALLLPSVQAHAPLANQHRLPIWEGLLPTPARAEEHLAVKPGFRSRAPGAKARGRCLENRPCAAPSFTCHLRASVGARVCWAWVPPLEDGNGQDKHLHDEHL